MRELLIANIVGKCAHILVDVGWRGAIIAGAGVGEERLS